MSLISNIIYKNVILFSFYNNLKNNFFNSFVILKVQKDRDSGSSYIYLKKKN